MVALLLSFGIINATTDEVEAETGKGTDIFKVIMTIFGVDRSRGDIVAMVMVNDGEVSKVRFFETDAPYVVPLNASESVNGGSFIEYVATFPNVTVNSGDEYKACVMTTKDLELICKIGINSPASRPEFTDLSFDAVDNLEQELIEDEGSTNQNG
jgi:hypothetical protein